MYPVPLKERHVKNFITMAHYLYDLSKGKEQNFSMEYYFMVDMGETETRMPGKYEISYTEMLENKVEGENLIHKCGTAACVLGHAGNLDTLIKGEDHNYDLGHFMWEQLSMVLFGVNLRGFDWYSWYIFSCKWSSVDDTPLGAAQRITYVLNWWLGNDEKQPHFNEGEFEKVHPDYVDVSDVSDTIKAEFEKSLGITEYRKLTAKDVPSFDQFDPEKFYKV